MIEWLRVHKLVVGYVILCLGVAAALAGVQHNNNQNRNLALRLEATARQAYFQACDRGNQLRKNLSKIQDARGDEIATIIDQMVTNDHTILLHIRGNIAAFITPGSADNPELVARLREVDQLIADQEAAAKGLLVHVKGQDTVARQLTQTVPCVYPDHGSG